MADFDIYDIQKKIGYEFKNPTLLKQAFTSPSITEATQHKVQNYQVLEFIGDSVLALAVVKNLAHDFCVIDNDGQMVCKTNEGKLTVRKQELIKNETLGHCSNLLGIEQYMNKAYGYSSVDYKNKRGDLVEAILGAVAFDSNWDMDVLCSVLKNILKYKDFEINYTEKLQKLCHKKGLGDPIYRFSQNEGSYECCVSVPNADRVFRSQAESELEAQNKACMDACKYFKDHKKLQILAENVDAISKLNLMYQAKEIEKPEYEFERFSALESLKWRCTASIPDMEYEFCTDGNTRQEAKRAAAEALLNYLTGNESENVIKDDENVVRGKGLLKLIMSKYYQLEKLAA